MPRTHDTTDEANRDSEALHIGFEQDDPTDWTTDPRNVHAALAELAARGGGSGDVILTAALTTDNRLIISDYSVGDHNVREVAVIFDDATNTLQFENVNPIIECSSTGSSPALRIDANRDGADSIIVVWNQGTGTNADILVYGNVQAQDGFAVQDDINIRWGTGGDAYVRYDASGTNHSTQFGIACGSAAQSGCVSIVEQSDVATANREAPAAYTDPHLLVWSADNAQDDDYLALYHDQTNARIDFGCNAAGAQQGFRIGRVGGTDVVQIDYTDYLTLGKDGDVTVGPASGGPYALEPGYDDGMDLGKGAVRFRDGYFGRDLDVEGEIAGSRLLIPFGYGATLSASGYMRTINGTDFSTTLGHIMMRPGSIVGCSCRANCGSFTGSGTARIEVRKNDTPVFTIDVTVSATGATATTWYGVQARGIDTFVAGDLLQVYYNKVSGTFSLDDFFGLVEITHNT